MNMIAFQDGKRAACLHSQAALMLLSTTLQEIPVANLPWILDLWGAVPLSSSEFSKLFFVAACCSTTFG